MVEPLAHTPTASAGGGRERGHICSWNPADQAPQPSPKSLLSHLFFARTKDGEKQPKASGPLWGSTVRSQSKAFCFRLKGRDVGSGTQVPAVWLCVI